MGNGYGAWMVPASGEYFSGDALKQELLVHQDAIILNYLTGSHFGTPDMVAQPGFEKLYGPWLLYINQGNDRELVADVSRRLNMSAPVGLTAGWMIRAIPAYALPSAAACTPMRRTLWWY